MEHKEAQLKYNILTQVDRGRQKLSHYKYRLFEIETRWVLWP